MRPGDQLLFADIFSVVGVAGAKFQRPHASATVQLDPRANCRRICGLQIAGGQIIYVNQIFVNCCWRRGRDSNPRYSCPYAAFRVRCFQPLSHLSRTSIPQAFDLAVGASRQTAPNARQYDVRRFCTAACGASSTRAATAPAHRRDRRRRSRAATSRSPSTRCRKSRPLPQEGPGTPWVSRASRSAGRQLRVRRAP